MFTKGNKLSFTTSFADFYILFLFLLTVEKDTVSNRSWKIQSVQCEQHQSKTGRKRRDHPDYCCKCHFEHLNHLQGDIPQLQYDTRWGWYQPHWWNEHPGFGSVLHCVWNCVGKNGTKGQTTDRIFFCTQ